MSNLKWSSADDAWVAQLTSHQFEALEIRVLTDGESTSPTDVQLNVVTLIEQIAQTGLPAMTGLARKYALAYLGPAEVDDMDEEDLAIDISEAIVPRLRDAANAYIIFVGNSDIDIEHGVAVVCQDGVKFAVTHSDIAYVNHDWDDTAEFEQILGE